MSEPPPIRQKARAFSSTDFCSQSFNNVHLCWFVCGCVFSIGGCSPLSPTWGRTPHGRGECERTFNSLLFHSPTRPQGAKGCSTICPNVLRANQMRGHYYINMSAISMLFAPNPPMLKPAKRNQTDMRAVLVDGEDYTQRSGDEREIQIRLEAQMPFQVVKNYDEDKEHEPDHDGYEMGDDDVIIRGPSMLATQICLTDTTNSLPQMQSWHRGTITRRIL